MHASKKPPLRATVSDSSATARDADISEINLATRQTRSSKPTVVYKLSESRIPRSGSNSGDSSPDVFTPKSLSSSAKSITPKTSTNSPKLLPVLSLKKKLSKAVASQTEALQQQQQQDDALSQSPAMAQPPPPSPPPLQISGDGALFPTPFEGKADEDADKWICYFKQYCEYKNITNKKPQIELFKLLMRGQAYDWFNGLEGNLDNFDAVEEAFNKRYKVSDLVKYRSARDLYSRKQGVNESCDDYVTAMKQIARKISNEPNEEMLHFAILNGLQGHISNAVISKSPKTIAELLEAARIAELTAQPDLSLPVMQQLNELRADMSRMSRQLEKRTTSVINRDRRSTTPEQRRSVTFSAPPASDKPNSYSPTPVRRVFEKPNPVRTSYEKSQQYSGGPTAKSACCTRCGYTHRTLRCPATDKVCLGCGRKGHFKVMCRSMNRGNQKQQ